MTILSPLPARLPDESPFVTHDARIWPVVRADMRSAFWIVERMARDCEQAAASRGFADLHDLLEFGWREDQVETYGPAAVGRAFPASDGGAA